MHENQNSLCKFLSNSKYCKNKIPALTHHETGNNHNNTEFHNSHTKCNALTYICV